MRTSAVIALLALLMTLATLTTPAPVVAQQEVPKEAINAAIERGVNFLKKAQRNGRWNWEEGADEQKHVGATALVGLALLEAEVPQTDPAVKDALGVVSSAAGRLTETYPVALAIMFLDKFGDAHSATIKGLAAKLLSRQNQTDKGWSYGYANQPAFAGSDNSNTQFAILGLWVARKHKVQGVEGALQKCEERFRKTQNQDGGWGYGGQAGQMTPTTYTMTCAGLLGLFLGFGAQKEKTATLRVADKPPDGKDLGGGAPRGPAPVNINDIRNDPKVQLALTLLGNVVKGSGTVETHWIYLLWSIERVGVIYEMNELNGVNWYHWGARIFLNMQQGNGSWIGDHGPIVDTSFALLFLKRSNLVGRIGEAVLTAGSGAAASAKPGASRPGSSPARKEPEPTSPEGLAQEIIRATTVMKQSQLIDEFKNRTGPEYTVALAIAAEKLGSATQDKARLALLERLENRKIVTVRQYFDSEHAELRRAAAQVAGRKGQDEVVPDLIKMLKDKNTAVADAAYEALKSLSGKSLDKDPKAWNDWWKSKGSK